MNDCFNCSYGPCINEHSVEDDWPSCALYPLAVPRGGQECHLAATAFSPKEGKWKSNSLNNISYAGTSSVPSRFIGTGRE